MHTLPATGAGWKGGNRAIFLDRDGTLVEPRHYPRRPGDLHIYPQVFEGMRLLQAADFRLVVITNQAGIARGLFDSADLKIMHDFLTDCFSANGIDLTGIYFCPHHPDGVVAEYAVSCECRKPKPGLLYAAADDLELSLTGSWFIGDILDDIEAGNRAGCRTVLVDQGTEPAPQQRIRTPLFVARDTESALAIVAQQEGIGPGTDLEYIPTRWTATQRPAEFVHAG